MDKSYIGMTEAWELALERGIDELPRKGREIVTVYSIVDNKAGKHNVALGLDKHGYYTREITV
jgi:hypothetical protein